MQLILLSTVQISELTVEKQGTVVRCPYGHMSEKMNLPVLPTVHYIEIYNFLVHL